MSVIRGGIVMTPGTVVRYTSGRPHSWCREGMAIADGRGLLEDTYWGGGSEAHYLTPAEIETAVVLFHVDDYDELSRHEQYSWVDYAPADRQMITSQHGLSKRLFVRKGAKPDLDTRIQNARDAVEVAERLVVSDQASLRWKIQELDRLNAIKRGDEEESA